MRKQINKKIIVVIVIICVFFLSGFDKEKTMANDGWDLEKEYVDDEVYDEGEDVIRYNEIAQDFHSVIGKNDSKSSTYATTSSVIPVTEKKILTRYSVSNGNGVQAGNYAISVTNGSEYRYDSSVTLNENGKILVDSSVSVSLKMVNSNDVISTQNIKTVSQGKSYIDLQKLLMKVTNSDISSITITFGGTGNVYLYGPYRIYSNTTINSNYSSNKAENTYVKFIKKSRTGVEFINTDDSSSENYISGKTTVITPADGYRAARNITFNSIYFDIDYNYSGVDDNVTNVNMIKMIHASDISISNCEFHANNSYNFRNHVIEFTAVKDSSISNCRFIADTYNVMTDDEVNNTYFNKEAIQIESARWASNPFAKFPDPFYTDVFNVTNNNCGFILPSNVGNWSNEYNQSQNISISDCLFNKVPNCVGDHLGSVRKNYSTGIYLENNNFYNSQIAIHLRSLKDVTIKDCNLNVGKITGYSKRVRCSNTLGEEYNNALYNQNVIFE